MKRIKLFINALVKYLVGFALIAILLFLPAGTFDYFGAWLFIGLLFIPIAAVGGILLVNHPQLLEKRLSTKEKENTQKGVVIFSFLMFVASFTVAGLDFRFGWSNVSHSVTMAASVVMMVSYIFYALVMKENAYLSRTVEVQKNQKVVDCGLYALVRHPMYTATILMFLSIPLVLGSWWAFITFLPYPFIIAVRIINEEKVLESGLAGYKEYKKKVRYRLIPFVW